MNMPFEVLPDHFSDQNQIEDILNLASHNLKERKVPFAILIKRNTFEEEKVNEEENIENSENDNLSTEFTIETLISKI